MVLHTEGMLLWVIEVGQYLKVCHCAGLLPDGHVGGGSS